MKFTASGINNEYISLQWETATEIENEGFEIERSINGIDFGKIAWVKGNGTSSEINKYSYNDRNIEQGTYSYRLKQIDCNSSFRYSNIAFASIFWGTNLQ